MGNGRLQELFPGETHQSAGFAQMRESEGKGNAAALRKSPAANSNRAFTKDVIRHAAGQINTSLRQREYDYPA